MYLVKILHRLGLAGRLQAEASTESSSAVSEDGQEKEEIHDTAGREHVGTRDVKWLVNRLSRLAKYEAAHHPKESLRRTCVLQWTAAVSLELGGEHLPSYLPALLRPVYRELVDPSRTSGESLHSLAQEVSELMKDVSGRESFSKAYSQVHQSAIAVREQRRKKAALEVSCQISRISLSV